MKSKHPVAREFLKNIKEKFLKSYVDPNYRIPIEMAKCFRDLTINILFKTGPRLFTAFHSLYGNKEGTRDMYLQKGDFEN